MELATTPAGGPTYPNKNFQILSMHINVHLYISRLSRYTYIDIGVNL